jgi:hypothetical protein
MNKQVEHIKTLRSYYNKEVKNWKSIRTKFYYFVRRDWIGYTEFGREIEKRWSKMFDMMSTDDQVLFLNTPENRQVNRIFKRRRSSKVNPRSRIS